MTLEELKKNKFLYIFIISSILFILFKSFQLERSIHTLDIALFLPIFRILFLGFLIVLSIPAIIMWFKKNDWKSIFIVAMTFLFIYFVPFEHLGRHINFKLNKSDREKVVKMVENGELQQFKDWYQSDGDPYRSIKLPKEYEHLSFNGVIAVEHTRYGNNVFFFCYNGKWFGDFDDPGDFSGFIYKVKDRIPSKNSFYGNLNEIDRMDKNWYFVHSSTHSSN